MVFNWPAGQPELPFLVENTRDSPNLFIIELLEQPGRAVITEVTPALIVFIDRSAKGSVETDCWVLVIHWIREHRVADQIDAHLLRSPK
jgi:hypothetical protein